VSAKAKTNHCVSVSGMKNKHFDFLHAARGMIVLHSDFEGIYTNTSTKKKST